MTLHQMFVKAALLWRELHPEDKQDWASHKAELYENLRALGYTFNKIEMRWLLIKLESKPIKMGKMLKGTSLAQRGNWKFRYAPVYIGRAEGHQRRRKIAFRHALKHDLYAVSVDGILYVRKVGTFEFHTWVDPERAAKVLPSLPLKQRKAQKGK